MNAAHVETPAPRFPWTLAVGWWVGLWAAGWLLLAWEAGYLVALALAAALVVRGQPWRHVAVVALGTPLFGGLALGALDAGWDSVRGRAVLQGVGDPAQAVGPIHPELRCARRASGAWCGTNAPPQTLALGYDLLRVTWVRAFGPGPNGYDGPLPDALDAMAALDEGGVEVELPLDTFTPVTWDVSGRSVQLDPEEVMWLWGELEGSLVGAGEGVRATLYEERVLLSEQTDAEGLSAIVAFDVETRRWLITYRS